MIDSVYADRLFELMMSPSENRRDTGKSAIACDQYGMIRQTYVELYTWHVMSLNLVKGILLFLEGSTYSNRNKLIPKEMECLSIMSGNCVLEQVLFSLGANIIATDKKPKKENCLRYLEKQHAKVIHAFDKPFNHEVVPIMNLDCIDAIIKYPRKVLLVSWPPYENEVATKALDLALKTGTKYVIYIGEWHGCCAITSFFQLLSNMTNQIGEIEMDGFRKIWDSCTIHKSKYSSIKKRKFRDDRLTMQIFQYVLNSNFKTAKKAKKMVWKLFKVRLLKKHVCHIMCYQRFGFEGA